MPQKRLTLHQRQYLDVAELFLWGRQIDFTAWFTGQWQSRSKLTETILPELEELNVINSKWFKGMKVYTTSKKQSNAYIPHGLESTKAIIRFKLSREGEFIPEKFFRGLKFKAVPEWAIKYPKGIILFEYSTADNFRRKDLMKKKVARYKNDLHRIEKVFKTQPIVLFLLQASEFQVEHFANQNGGENIFYVDHKTFMETPIGKQLSSPIYIWGGDRKTYPLSDHD